MQDLANASFGWTLKRKKMDDMITSDAVHQNNAGRVYMRMGSL